MKGFIVCFMLYYECIKYYYDVLIDIIIINKDIDQCCGGYKIQFFKIKK